MSRTARMIIFAVGGLGLAVLLGFAIGGMPHFGDAHHPYRTLAVRAALRHVTPNAVSSVNFDQRGIDTLGEEMILVGSVAGSVALLRPSRRERDRKMSHGGRVMPSTQFVGYALLPFTVAIGLDVVVHGHLTPGGGFQGGVILATGLHLVYVTGDFAALQRLRPVSWFHGGEAAGAGGFVLLALAGLATAGAFMANIVPFGSFRALLSAGTVPMFNVVTGLAVACGMVVLLAAFLRQEVLIADSGSASGSEDDQ